MTIDNALMPPERRRASRPPTSGERSAPFRLRSNADDAPEDGWTLDGYGAVFNRMTVVDSWEGIFRELIANNSMKKSFRESPPIVQYDHGRHPWIGSLPIAELLSAVEDTDPELAPDGGAHIVARMYPYPILQLLREAIATKQIKGMSFRFSVIREMWQTADGKKIKDDNELLNELSRTWDGTVPEEELPIRTLQELRVPEMGPVCWPAYLDTSIGMRDQIIDLSKLDTDEEQRKLLARKLFVMPNLGVAHTQDAPQTTENKSAGEHPSEFDDAPQTTGNRSAGEHPSKPRWLSNKELRLRNQRDRLLTLRQIGERS